LITLATGVVITNLLSTGLGLITRGNVLSIVDSFPDEITACLESKLLDLGIALAAGAIATYTKVNPAAVSSMAGKAIAVDLLPPVCDMVIMLGAGELDQAQ
jgi:uncharacterized membrane protein